MGTWKLPILHHQNKPWASCCDCGFGVGHLASLSPSLLDQTWEPYFFSIAGASLSIHLFPVPFILCSLSSWVWFPSLCAPPLSWATQSTTSSAQLQIPADTDSTRLSLPFLNHILHSGILPYHPVHSIAYPFLFPSCPREHNLANLTKLPCLHPSLLCSCLCCLGVFIISDTFLSIQQAYLSSMNNCEKVCLTCESPAPTLEDKTCTEMYPFSLCDFRHYGEVSFDNKLKVITAYK